MDPITAPIMLLEVLDTHGRVQLRQRICGSGAVCKIGRGLNCDIVLDDAYAAAEHTQLTLQDDGRIAIADLNNINGTRLNGARLRVDTPAIVADGLLIIGRTRVRLRSSHSQLAPEKRFRRDVLQRHRTAFAVSGFSATLAFVIFNRWVDAPEALAPSLLTALSVVLGGLGLWIGLWALITRIGHGAWTLRTHIAIAANAVAVAAWSNWLLNVAVFATQWLWLATLGTTTILAAACGALFLHLRRATHIELRLATVIAVTAPLLIGGTYSWLSQQSSTRNVSRIALGADVFPPVLLHADAVDLDTFLARSKTLQHRAVQNRAASLRETPIAD